MNGASGPGEADHHSERSVAGPLHTLVMLSSCDEKTQYALLASIGTDGRILFAAASGALVDWLDGDWGTFFVITTLMVVPSLVCLWAIRKRLGDLLAGARVRLSGKEVEGGSGGAN